MAQYNNTLFQRLKLTQFLQCISFSSLTTTERLIFEYTYMPFSTFQMLWQPTKISKCLKSHMSDRGHANKHFCKRTVMIFAITIFNFPTEKQRQPQAATTTKNDSAMGKNKTVFLWKLMQRNPSVDTKAYV